MTLEVVLVAPERTVFHPSKTCLQVVRRRKMMNELWSDRDRRLQKREDMECLAFVLAMPVFYFLAICLMSL